MMFSQVALLLLLSLALFVKHAEGDDSDDYTGVANRVSKVTKNQQPKESTPVSEHVDSWRGRRSSATRTPNKRNTPDGEVSNIVETDAKGLGTAIEGYITERLDSSMKRTIDNRTTPWNYKIPLIFDSSYSDLFLRNIVRRVAKYLSAKTCLTITDVTDKWDSSNANWFIQNGYTCNCYIRIFEGTGCTTSGSGPVNGSYVNESPCHDTDIALHETFHALAVNHEQQASVAPSYISVFNDIITPYYKFTYDSSQPSIQTPNFDSTTTELYNVGTWSATGENTYLFIRPVQGRPDQSTSGERSNLEQINSRYKCADKFCSNSVDCSPGYLTRLESGCGCVCPPELDPKSNCKKFVEGPDTSLKWGIPVTLLAGGTPYKCPAGFQQTGWLSFCGNWANPQGPSPGPFPSSGTTTSFPVCSKPDPTSNVDWNWLPIGGNYCIMKPAGVDCGGVFTQATVSFQSVCPPQYNGSLGDTTISGNTITMQLCCQNHEDGETESILPNEVPFRLLSIYGCPNVQGMRVYEHYITIYTKTSSVTATAIKPKVWSYSSSIVINFCYYQPPVYGCSQKVTMSSSNKKVTITTKGYPEPRPANTRCFYCFDGPEGSKFKVSFTDYDLHADDKMRIKIFHQWAAPTRIDNDNPWKQFVTEKNYLCMEFWTGYLTNATNRGASFTVDLLLPSDSCYDTSVNGQDYVGTTSISETNEPCLTWKETAGCFDSPINAQDALTGYFESNYCRNPGGNLLQPWCYVYKNNTSCLKRYCDVCNIVAPADSIKSSDCADAISKDSTFCQKSFHRNLCFKTCGMKQAPTGSVGTCSAPPPVPSDGKLVGSAKSSYKAGERAYVKCKSSPDSDKSKLVLCTRDGWKGPVSACDDCPFGYTIYGDRCIFFSATVTTRPDALAFCNSLGRNGTFMHPRNAADQTLMSTIRNQTGSINQHSWLGVNLADPATGAWTLLGTNTPLTYNNWNGDTVPKNAAYSTAYMYRESSTSGRSTKYVACSSDDTTTKYTYFCQIDRKNPPSTDDEYDTCQDTLTTFPSFCKDEETLVDAALLCAKSCGVTLATSKCSQPTSSTYTRINGSGSISPGDYMTFQCKAGYFQTGGDAKRACGLSGTLLGTAPVCDNNPSSVDVGLNLVIARRDTLVSDLVFVLDLEDYRVPISGKITTWYYQCNQPGQIYFLAFRKSGSSYNIIGNTNITCMAGNRMSYSVPTSDQTSVAAGDVVGAWSPDDDTLCVNLCDSSSIKISMIPTASPSTAAALLTTTSYTNYPRIAEIAYTMTDHYLSRIIFLLGNVAQ